VVVQRAMQRQPAPVREHRARHVHDHAVRAVLDSGRAAARRPSHTAMAAFGKRNWASHIRARALVPKSAFVHHKASVIGRVVLGEHVHIAATASVRADEGAPFFIGGNSNIQDGVVIHALKDRYVRVDDEEWAVYVGRNVSLAHDALVHGPCYVGDDTFIGFKAVVHDAVIGSHCFIGIGAVVVGVEIPDKKFVPPGSVIDSAAKVKSLADVSHSHLEFNEDVVEVNRGLAEAYRGQAPKPAAASRPDVKMVPEREPDVF
jgi:sulfate permease, SulP family